MLVQFSLDLSSCCFSSCCFRVRDRRIEFSPSLGLAIAKHPALCRSTRLMYSSVRSRNRNFARLPAIEAFIC